MLIQFLTRVFSRRRQGIRQFVADMENHSRPRPEAIFCSDAERRRMATTTADFRNTYYGTQSILAAGMFAAVGVSCWCFFSQRKMSEEIVMGNVAKSRHVYGNSEEIVEAEPIKPIKIRDEDLASEESLWSLYERWGENYNVPTDPKRFEVFKKNVKYVHDMNKQNLSYTLAANMFVDMTYDERRKGGIDRRLGELAETKKKKRSGGGLKVEA